MNRKININFNQIIYILNIICVILIFIYPPIEMLFATVTYNILKINVFLPETYIIIWFITFFEFIIYTYNLVKVKRITIFDIIIYILIFLTIISTIFSKSISTSIYGTFMRNEGLISLICYYLIFLNARMLKNNDVSKILKLYIGLGIGQFFLCLCQVFIRGFFSADVFFNYMARGFYGNPNFLGSSVIMLLSICLGLYLFNNNKKFLYLTILFFINLIMAQSTGPFISFIFLMLCLFIYVLYKRKNLLKKFTIMSLILVITYFVFSNSLNYIFTNFYNDDLTGKLTIEGDLSTITDFSDLDSYGSGRLYIWKEVSLLIPKYFWTGIGPDNLVYAIDDQKQMFIKTGGYCDKAHNIYLQTAITTGVPSLIIYLLLIFLIFLKAIKSKDSLILSLGLGFIAYSIQGFMNVNIIQLTPIYYFFMGLIINLNDKDLLKNI